MSINVHKQNIKFLLDLRGEFLEVAAKSAGGVSDAQAPYLNLAYAETISHALDLMDRGFYQEALAPLKKIETVFNQQAQAETSESTKIFGMVLDFGNKGSPARGSVFEEKAQRMREIQASLVL